MHVASESNRVANLLQTLQNGKYHELTTHLFHASRWGLWKMTLSSLVELGHSISALSGDSREITFLFQRVSVLVQRFNSVLLRESFTVLQTAARKMI